MASEQRKPNNKGENKTEHRLRAERGVSMRNAVPEREQATKKGRLNSPEPTGYGRSFEEEGIGFTVFTVKAYNTCCTLSVRPRMAQRPVFTLNHRSTALLHVWYLCSSPVCTETVLQRWPHTQHNMEACRTRQFFNLPLQASSCCAFNPQQVKSLKLSLFLPSLSLCKW